MPPTITYIQKYGPLEIESVPTQYDPSRMKEHILLIEHDMERYHIGTFSPGYKPKDTEAVTTMLTGAMALVCITKALYSLITD